MQYVAQDLPVIPTVNSAAWFEFNAQRFTGWPSESNAGRNCRISPPATAAPSAQITLQSLTTIRPVEPL